MATADLADVIEPDRHLQADALALPATWIIRLTTPRPGSPPA